MPMGRLKLVGQPTAALLRALDQVGTIMSIAYGR
jgi:hypothetical protein